LSCGENGRRIWFKIFEVKLFIKFKKFLRVVFLNNFWGGSTLGQTFSHNKKGQIKNLHIVSGVEKQIIT
jgi:hypothetical protein